MLSLEPTQAPPGSVVVGRLEGFAPAGAVLAGFRQEAGFYVSGGRSVALLAVPLETKPGWYSVILRWPGGRVEGRIRVLESPYPVLRVRRVPRLRQALLASAAEGERDLIARTVAESGGPPRWRSHFRWPLAETVTVTSPFGSRRRYNEGKLGWTHRGVDLRAAEGTQVLAAADGLVLLAEKAFKATGGTVILDHGYGVTTGYYHLSAVEVSPGQILQSGERLGLSGATGIANGPHLHFQVNLRGFAVDPTQWLGPGPVPVGSVQP